MYNSTAMVMPETQMFAVKTETIHTMCNIHQGSITRKGAQPVDYCILRKGEPRTVEGEAISQRRINIS